MLNGQNQSHSQVRGDRGLLQDTGGVNERIELQAQSLCCQIQLI